MSRADDAHWMARALRLAARGRGTTRPNPMVGAVVVRNGRVVGEGWHRRPGEPHAEIHALRAAGAAARGATVYVNLEPCAHHGRTPPCADALIAAGVARVVAACVDPDPRVSGKGIAALKAAGIDVEVGVLAERACRLNEAYLKWTRTGLPFVSLKTAMSLDGKIATGSGESRWITGERARTVVHRLRARHDAVLVGVGTVLADDPQLTARLAGARQPLRVVADSRGRTPATARIMQTGDRPPVIAVTRLAPAARRERLAKAGAEVWVVPHSRGRLRLERLAARLAGIGMQSVLLEGGGTIAASALAAGLVDRVYFFVAPKLIGGREAPTPVEGEGVRRLADAWRIAGLSVRRVGEDLMIVGDVVR